MFRSPIMKHALFPLTAGTARRSGQGTPDRGRSCHTRKEIFKFHEDDHPFVGEGCVRWAGPRYLQFNAGRLALIDIDSMKMNYPVPRSTPGTSASYTFSPDFRWVLCQKEENEKAGLYLGRVVKPDESRTP